MRIFAFCFLALSLLAKTPAESKIEQAEAVLASDPKRNDAWVALAEGYVRRARETGQDSWCKQADDALNHVPKAAEQYEANRVRVRLLLRRGDYVAALELARTLNKRMPDELAIYGFIVEAGMALGRYDEAEKAAQWMLDLRPNSTEGLMRAASLREVFGDYEGSLQFLRQVYKGLQPEEAEERAWTATEIARNLTAKGDYPSAEIAIHNALKGFPDYHLAWERLGKLRLAHKRAMDAIAPLQKRFDTTGTAAAAYDLATAFHRAGREVEAKATFTRFEELARDGHSERERIFYLADIAGRPAEALQIATKLAMIRQDVYTLDALAWAYFRNGKQSEAESVMSKVRKVGVKDPDILSHDRRISPEP